MAQITKPCGPDAKELYDSEYSGKMYNKYKKMFQFYVRNHSIIGNGLVSNCEMLGKRSFAIGSVPYYDNYIVEDGITELGDGCFDSQAVHFVQLPKTLKKIGNHCFEHAPFGYINLPDSLEEIGEWNFSSNVTELTIPHLVRHFPASNFYLCKTLSVHSDSKYYKEIAGIVYSFDMTVIVFCNRDKTGDVVIPPSVKEIGDFCFYGCKAVSSIIIPASVEKIGKESFSCTEMAKLIVPNSVKVIGEGCFSHMTVLDKFRMSTYIDRLPKGCFEQSKVYGEFSFESNTEYEESALQNFTFLPAMPETIRLKEAIKIGKRTFYGNKLPKTYELFSSLREVGSEAFGNTASDLKIRYFSLVPCGLPAGAFAGVSKDATLVVLPGTKKIFENAIPWSSFGHIEELPENVDKDNDGNMVEVPEEIYQMRLKSIVESKNNIDRDFLKGIIENLALYYTQVDSPEEWDEAWLLIKYNRSFGAPIVDGLEQRMCSEWSNKHKMQLISNAYSCMNSPIQLGITSTSIANSDDAILPLNNVVELIPEAATNTSLAGTVESYFENILSVIQNELSNAKKSVKVAVSWFTNYALFKQIKGLVQNGIKVQMIINNDLINNGGYCLDLNELIQEEDFELSLVEYPHLLHHKFCIIDDEVVINGSYNWTRFSASNYENITVFRGLENVVESFCNEFDNILQAAKYKKVDKMPEVVPDRPEYDRSAFRQYITEELDAEARETLDEREKITKLHAAAKLNPGYFEKINPEGEKTYEKHFMVLDESEVANREIVNMVSLSGNVETVNRGDEPNKQVSTAAPKSVSVSTANQTAGRISASNVKQAEAKQVVKTVQASSLYMAIDYSGSMQNVFDSGLAHRVIRSALVLAISVSEKQELSLWTYTDSAKDQGLIGINTIQKIEELKCPSGGTNIDSFVERVLNILPQGSLVLIFTDGEDSSCSNAIAKMKSKKEVFWQIIGYGTGFEKMAEDIADLPNASFVMSENFDKLDSSAQREQLLSAYINWKNRG